MKLNEQITRMNLLTEGLNLNLLKQLTAKQRKQKAHQELEQIFGKNIYRLYYDLDTGAQINPKRTDPKLKVDVQISDDLQKDVTAALSQFEFSVVDFEKNVAKNDRNNQQTKITKALAQYDKGLLTKYTDFLENMTRNTSGKFYAVISRHVADMAIMGTHFGTCESLDDVNDISQTYFASPGGENTSGDGNGERAYYMMRNGDLIFYMIKEGDWNIQHPVARFANGAYCIDNGPIYGDFSPKFKNFIKKWLYNFELKVKQVPGLEDQGSFLQRPVEDLADKFQQAITHNRVFNKMDPSEFLRELIINKRFDVIQASFGKIHGDYLKSVVRIFVNLLENNMSLHVVKTFPEALKALILKYVNEEVSQIHSAAQHAQHTLSAILKNATAYFEQLGQVISYIKMDEHVITQMVGLNADLVLNISKKGNGQYIPLLKLAKMFGSTEAAEVLAVADTLYEYRFGSKYREFMLKAMHGLEQAKEKLGFAVFSEQVQKIKKLGSGK